MNAPLSFTKEDNIDSIVKFFVSEPKTVGQISEML